MKILTILLLLLPAQARAQTTPPSINSIPGLSETVAQYVKQAKAVGFSDFHGKLGTGVMLPIRTLKDSAGVKYAMAGIGGAIKEGEHAKPKFGTMLDLSAIFRRVESSSAWYNAHVDKVTLPDFWLGPTLDLPMPGDAVTWRDFGNITTWARYSGVALSVGF